MHLRYAFRIEPTAGQRIAPARTFGCARVVYNDAPAAQKAAWTADRSRIATGALAKRVITDAKRTPERTWLAEVSVDALQSSLRDLDKAYAIFFASVTGKRRGRRMGLPVFKSKKDRRQSIRFSRNGFRLRDNGRLYLAKIVDVRVRWSRPLPVAPSSATVVRDPAGRYFARFVVEIEPEMLPPAGTEVGIDLGYLEDLALSGLARTRLAKSVHDAAWGMFRRLLEEKAARAGRHVGVVSRWLPSSQTCSVCGVVDGKKPLHVRTWRCGACGTEHDRDLNASRVILTAGQAERQNAPGGPVSPGVEIPCQARPAERGTHPKAQPVTTGSLPGIPAL
ncbi:RNA-guided endonuclease InsQ/TnpB family protein [Streptomyces erythrochromogenes]|uniref:RNA-guided endonuclease InsQ/TnpB family protein n=1 Tax=Streptomyces erythrochromogenes TaxID=285574 RepID=UPI00386DEAF1|nr:transposase [Streptomyces erythrochromogenes]